MTRRRRNIARLPLVVLVLAVLTMLPVGCADARRQSIEGTVTLDGQPLAEGCIRLLPREGTPGPTAGATIKDGRFAIDATKGTFAGSFRVEIVAMRPNGRFAVDPETGEKIPLREQYLPARYNTQSELTAEIAEGRPNELVFEIVSR
ncbi:MAG: hypothetical protein JW809_05405 [Pirellulales bacterium]|nr:hypothetical protein [Pirellulales bacterium]